MWYNQNKKVALNISKPLGVRYISFLRCVSSVCILSKTPFNRLLSTMNPAFSVKGNKANLSELICSSIDKLDSYRSIAITGGNILDSDDKAVYAIEMPSNESYQNKLDENNNTYPKCFNCICVVASKLFKFINVQVKQQLTTNRRLKIELQKEYRSLSPAIESRAKELFHTLNIKLKHEEKCLAFPVQHRIKTWDSVNEKIGRVKLNINSVTEMQDLIGFRVVTVFERDVNKIINIIERNFNVVRKYLPKKHKGATNYYTSVHMVIDSHKHSFLKPRTNADKKILTEIQIMTLAQFTYAKASHLLQYKNNVPIAENSIRALQRTSALLETVDLEFERILEDHQKYT